jgi:transcriptional regulator with XRE-family HTH domain
MKNTEFSEILKHFLQANQLTQTEFAMKIGVKQSQVSEWLKGKAKPGYDSLKQMVIAYELSPNYLLGLEDEF